MSVAFYMDVHVHAGVTEQLRRRGVNVLTAQDDDTLQATDEELLERSTTLGRVLFTTLQATDEELLERSTTLGRVLFTHDIHFKALAEAWQRQAKPFAGLLWGHPMRLTIGQMVTDLELVANASDLADWQGVVDQLPL